MATSAVCAVLTGWVVSGIGPASAQAGYAYTYTDLGALWSGSSEARAINDAGQVVGYLLTPQFATLAGLWSGGALIPLPSIGGASAQANDINNAGQIVGHSDARPVQWRNGLVADLTLGNATLFGTATGINEAGAITGYLGVRTAQPQIQLPTTAVTWDPQGMRVDLPDDTTVASGLAINSLGQVAGYVGNYVNGNHNPARTAPATWMPAFSTQPGLQYGAIASDINERGQSVGTIGYSTGTAAPFPQAMLWHDGITVDLGPGEAYALNEATQIVGYARTGTSNQYAALWHDGTVLDLNAAVDPASLAGWVLSTALDINESGSIVGVATHDATGVRHAYLLSPVPEPAALVLMLAGLAALGLSRRTSSAL